MFRSQGIKQESTTADIPQSNGVAERELGVIQTAAIMAGRIKAPEHCPGAQLSATSLLWAKVSRYACEALNHTARSPNLESKPLHEMWHGSPPPR